MVKGINNNETSWFDLFMLFLFNIGDTIGRTLGGKEFAKLGRKATLIGSYARIIFFLTFIPIMFASSGFFDTDVLKITNALLFAISNGYFSTLCAIAAPGTVNE